MSPSFTRIAAAQKDPWYGDNSQSTLWQAKKPAANRIHPTAKPVELVERLGYSKESLLAQAGVSRSDFDDPHAHISCVATGAVLCAAMQERPMKNLAMRTAAETPIGAFLLIDYLVVTSEGVGSGLQQLARYFRLVDAPYTLDLREDEDPIRVLFHSPANPFSVEFGVTLTVLHLRGD